MTRQLKILILLVSAAVPFEINASVGRLVQQVESFLLEEIDDSYPDAIEVNLTVRPPDTRLPLQECQTPKLSLHGAQQVRSRVLVRAECSETFVLHLAAVIEIKQLVVVTTTALRRQSLLTPDQLETQPVNILANNRQFLTSLSEATGKVLTRSVRAGALLTAGMLKTPDLVSRGDSVVIIASRGDLVVRMPGVAMATGGMNEQIKVRNESSDRVVKGWIKAPGEVHVPF
ncbi:MAG: flagella basal body P-ring formation protein FlgA [Candidatus Azotimanducaceae bacterium]|jgi:flagella basal body P-ring formation protein FlgA